MTERRYSEQQVREILARAVEDRTSHALQSSKGMTLAELKDIGAEAGIDPSSVERAALAVDAAEPGRYSGLIGAPMSLSTHRSVAAPLDPELMPELVAMIRQGMGRSGELAEVHGMVEWRATGDGGERVITLSERAGTTSIQGTAELRTAATVAYLPAGIVTTMASIGAVISAADSGNPRGLIAAVVGVTLVYLVIRTIFGRYVAREEERMTAVVDDLGRAVLTSRSDDDV